MDMTFDYAGLPLVDDWSEIVYDDDTDFPAPLDYGKIKVRAWRGHNYINNPMTDLAGVDLILAENWWP
jgi:hypothetical protein